MHPDRHIAGNLDTALPWVGKHDAVDGWHVDPLRQTSHVGHERSPRLPNELAQGIGAFASGLLA
jgi:hypothetical protein